MPPVVKPNLNQCIRGSFQAAEIIGNPRAFVGLAIKNQANQRVAISGLIWSVLITNQADRPNVDVNLCIQRNLDLTSSSIFPGVENAEEMVFQYFTGDRNGTGFADMKAFTRPIVLESGYPYGATISLSPTAAIVGTMVLSLTVLGEQVSGDGKPFPYELR